jgi:hypothetical protein
VRNGILIRPRWISQDPIGEAGGLNLYGYVSNNPVNWVDPWGLAPAPGTPPPVPVPGAGPGNGWKPSKPSNGARGERWDPKFPIPGQSQPSASWDEENDHWDVDDGKGRRRRYDEEGNEVAHKCPTPASGWDTPMGVPWWMWVPLIPLIPLFGN